MTINKAIKVIRSEKGSISFLLASMALWLFIIGFIGDLSRALLIRRWVSIELDHSLKAAAKQLDENYLAENQVVIVNSEAQQVFSKTLADSFGFSNSFPVFTPPENSMFAGDLVVEEFDVLNYPTPATPVTLTDPLDSSVKFNYPTCHAIVRFPIDTFFWRFFGFNQLTIKIHADASNEIL